MKTRTILDGNAFYEIDEECIEQGRLAKAEAEQKQQEARERQAIPSSRLRSQMKNR